jgi:hypothetical protein
MRNLEVAELTICGQTILILMQHLSSFQTSQRDDRITAVQHNFPKAVIQYGLTK